MSFFSLFVYERFYTDDDERYFVSTALPYVAVCMMLFYGSIVTYIYILLINLSTCICIVSIL